VIGAVILVFMMLLYTYTLGSNVSPTVYYLKDRVTFTIPFYKYVIDKQIDQVGLSILLGIWVYLLWPGKSKNFFAILYGLIVVFSAILNSEFVFTALSLSSLPTIAVLLYSNKLDPLRISHLKSLTAAYFAFLIIATSGILAVSSLLQVPGTNEIIVQPYTYAYDLYLLLVTVSPLLVILLTFGFFFKTGLVELCKSFGFKISNITELSSPLRVIKNRHLLLVLCIILSIFVAWLPHEHPQIVPGRGIGVDTHYYVDWLNALNNSTSLADLITQAFVIQQHGDRPLTLLLMYGVLKVFSVEELFPSIEYTPLFLAPLLVLIVYLFSYQLTSNSYVAILSSLLTAISTQSLAGIYAGSYANWLGIIFGYLSLTLLLRYLVSSSKRNLLLYSIVLIVLLFTHVYTWSVIALLSGIFLIISIKIKYFSRRHVIALLIIISASAVIDISRTILTGSYSGIGYDLEFAQQTIELNELTARLKNIVDTTQIFYGGAFGNVIIYGLAMYWLIRTPMREVHSALILIFLSLGIIPIFLGTWAVQTRILYDIPFQIPAAIGIVMLSRVRYGNMLSAAFIIWILAITIRTATNYVLIIPE